MKIFLNKKAQWTRLGRNYNKRMNSDAKFREKESKSNGFIFLSSLWLVFGLFILYYLDMNFIFYFVILIYLIGKSFDYKLNYENKSCMDGTYALMSFFIIYYIYQEIFLVNSMTFSFIGALIVYALIKFFKSKEVFRKIKKMMEKL
jgi:hypothetical protein